MATATRKTTKYRKAASPKKRRTAVAARKSKKPNPIVSALVPLVSILALLAGVVFLLVTGLRAIAASSVFDVKRIETQGNSRVSAEDISKAIRVKLDRQGAWNADLDALKAEVEKIPYVKRAIVTRLLPDGLQASVIEKIPRALVRAEQGDLWWIDDDGDKIAPLGKNENRLPILKGWDAGTPKENAEKMKIYAKIRDDIQSVPIDKKISQIDLSNVQDAVLAVGDSGETVFVSLGKEEFGKRFQTALPYIEGKGKSIESIRSYGGYPIATYRSQERQN